MTYEIIRPPKDLEQWVSHCWVSRLDSQEQADFTYYATANTNTELAFAFKASCSGHSELLFSSAQGHTALAAQVPASGFVEMLGVSLFSYAIPSLLNVSTGELKDQLADIDTLLGADGKMLNEQIASALSVRDRLGILMDYFRRQLRRNIAQDPVIMDAMRHIRRTHGRVNVTGLAGAGCLSPKQFERRFTAYAGFTPKLYARIIRFESALWNCRKFENLTEAAHASGYYDQAHFIHDFKAFTGFSPKKFLALAGY